MDTPETLNSSPSFAENMSYFDRILDQSFAWFSANLGTLLFIIFIGMGTILVARTVNHLMESYFTKASGKLRMDTTAFRMFRHVTVASIYFIGLIIIIFSIPDLRSLSVALFTGAGLAGIVIGFAAQSTLSNIIAGISLVIFQPFRVGDRLNIMNEYGKVTDLNLRHTVIITWDNRRLIIPNSIISNEAVINWTIEDPAVIWPINVGIGYDSDISLAKKIMIEEARKHPLVMPPQTMKHSVIKPSFLKPETLANGFMDLSVLHTVDPDFRERGEVKVYVTDLGDFSVNLRLLVWFKDRSDAYSSGCEIREAIKRRFDSEGIEIPYPYRTIVYKTDIQKEKSPEKSASEEKSKMEYAPRSRLTDIDDETGQ
ncbi:mechanosensitive ion channel protein MscS [Methanosarcina sp. 2.H.T.1A.6]|uniref:mechanosensitive ion channel family protein n=1 Tax=unclassified Methanosarcina TaxID=2644672 RepID=UPI0006213A83|nr:MULTISPECIES: mechanosensitive ion channel family protein [unclassified Methanosarcina]KKG12544.1 mechanosensitive ion channel protein MscS [Methanosarcina sp. 2.H.T.1A.15]KKG15763.1 mechanosensitive ion channel protein MscS [Methanosarcina sp. 2.H.T.1A.3]KKG20605.1 mechanosensitive ion channel protein MscS [Methanosarcina sp. 2.H.T.1A.6]KKG23165.1 mechanosensitive ion channel protein MscS [Methanosarcina sp. 2.H.T.1A.8]